MPTYHIIINGQPTEDLVTGDTYIDAYFSASEKVPNDYKKDFKLVKVEEESED
ncbi:Hypothetical protein LUCI_3410 [Lucifera butyrica]|uniref:Uncharacterized protein n=1 Tax=Lucifera butyrica TaxID=1351585 RepID=A0A498RAX3_9FIRM|nr:hypothetical protein [Lucifera butyrica]VBB08145.1 Hypothetical protein LUCI_3410 [Lucifera butyrica]